MEKNIIFNWEGQDRLTTCHRVMNAKKEKKITIKARPHNYWKSEKELIECGEGRAARIDQNELCCEAH